MNENKRRLSRSLRPIRPPSRLLQLTFRSICIFGLFCYVAGIYLVVIGIRDIKTVLGCQHLFFGAGLILLTVPMPAGLLHTWLCRIAVRRLSPEWQKGEDPLPFWPGVSEKKGRLRAKVGSGTFRCWVLALGLWGSAIMLISLGIPEDQNFALGLIFSLTPTLIGMLLSELWGPSGWRMEINSTKQTANWIKWKPFRKDKRSSSGLPTIQEIEYGLDEAEHHQIVLRRARGRSWHLRLPLEWPTQLGEAFAFRLAHNIGLELRRNKKSESEIVREGKAE
jgi:hypothetical protein